MGTWGAGIFEGDGALDCVGGLTCWLEEQLGELAEQDSTPDVAARLGAVIGLTLQLSPYTFEKDAQRVLDAIATHREQLDEVLSSEGLGLIERIEAGDGEALCDGLRETRRQGGSPDVEVLAGGYGVPAGGLLEHPAAKEIAQRLADRCAAVVDEGFERKDELDLYEVEFMGALGLLLLIEPCEVDCERVERWRESLQQVYARQQEEQDDGDMEFFSEYMENAEKAFELALEKFG